MAALSVILLVLFVLVSLLLIFVISIQSEDDSGLGGVFGGNSNSAFGGRTNKVMNKITGWLVGAFIVLAVLVAVINHTPDSSILAKAASTVEEVVAAN